MKNFFVNTPQNCFRVFYDFGFIDKKDVRTDYDLFSKMCKNGCVNFNQKYSCPPFSPKFSKIIGNKEGLFVIIFLTNLKDIASTEYNKIRIANSIMKSRIEKLMRFIETKSKTIFLSTGSCRLCRPCKIKLNLPCRFPDKMRYSLESTGIDCNHITKYLFNKKLLWYKNKLSPDYTLVLGGILCNKKNVTNLKKIIKSYINNYFLPKPAKTKCL